jgi:hypothetical protein
MRMVVEAREAHPRGCLYRLAVGHAQYRLLFTFHAIGRMTTWSLTERQVVRTLIEPEEFFEVIAIASSRTDGSGRT